MTDGADQHSVHAIEDAEEAVKKCPWTLLVVGLEVPPDVRLCCERLAAASPQGIYMHAADAGSGLDAAFAAVAAQYARAAATPPAPAPARFVMPTVKSADAAAAGGGARGI